MDRAASDMKYQWYGILHFLYANYNPDMQGINCTTWKSNVIRHYTNYHPYRPSKITNFLNNNVKEEEFTFIALRTLVIYILLYRVVVIVS